MKTYDAHYLIGNYYQYNAATLGGGGTKESPVGVHTDTTRSVCPKGWKLPTAGNQKNDSVAFENKKGSFYNLLAQYGYSNSKGYVGDSNNPYTTIIKGSDIDGYRDNVAAHPLYFVRNGYVHLSTGFLKDAGIRGTYWSATTGPDAIVGYNLEFNAASVFPSFRNGRYHGFSVRCIAE